MRNVKFNDVLIGIVAILAAALYYGQPQPARAADPFPSAPFTLSVPFTHVAAVTPSDSVDMAIFPRGLWVSAAGTVSVIAMDDASNTAVPLGSLSVGTVIPVRVKRVMTTGTTATIVAGW